MEEQSEEFTCFLDDYDWIFMFVYLADIFKNLNLVNFGF